MRLINRSSLERVGVAGCLMLVAVVGGCHQFPDVFFDDLPPSSLVTTNSAFIARSHGAEPILRDRGFERRIVEEQDGAVSHGPLWFEDPMELVGSDDDQFAITNEDLLVAVYSPGRFAANVLLWPVTLFVHPQWQVQCSDGVATRSRRSGLTEPYDAQPCAGETGLIDIRETWTFHELHPDVGDEPMGEALAEDADAPEGDDASEPEDTDAEDGDDRG